MGRMVGDVIRNIRTAKGLSLGQVAYRTGFTKEGIRAIETGRTKSPTLDTLTKIAKGLDVSVEYILARVGLVIPKDPNLALSPEVRQLDEIVRSYPEGPCREWAKQMVLSVGHLLESTRPPE